MGVSKQELIFQIINQVEGLSKLELEKKNMNELLGIQKSYEVQQKKTTKASKKKNNEDNTFLKNRGRLVGGFLSLMFAGMALSRAMNGLLKTSLEWVGITELMSLALGELFLPVALDILNNFALPFLDWVSNLSPGMKKMIGWFVVIAGVLGGIVSVAGQLGLALIGLQALKMGGIMSGLFGIGSSAEKASGKVSLLKKGLGKLVGIALGITITIGSISLMSKGIEKGSLLKELGGVIGAALGIATVLLTAGVGGGLAFTIGILGSIAIDWALGGKIGKAALTPGILGHPAKLSVTDMLGIPNVADIPSMLRHKKSGSGGGMGMSLDTAYPDFAGNGPSSPSVTFSPTYNVNGADKNLFMNILKEHDEKQKRDLQGAIKRA